jgi:hypothetical protein
VGRMAVELCRGGVGRYSSQVEILAIARFGANVQGLRVFCCGRHVVSVSPGGFFGTKVRHALKKGLVGGHSATS